MTTARLLVVEDNPGDVLLLRKAFERSGFDCALDVVTDGDTALSLLWRGLRPDLILLDLNLPGRDGREVLQEVKESQELRHIPVVVLSSSAAEGDILNSYELHANSYVTKPRTLEALTAVVDALSSYWFEAAALPRPEMAP